MNKRIIFALLSLPLASLLAIIALALRGQTGEIIPIGDQNAWAQNVIQPIYLIAQRLYIISYVLPLFGLWAMYACLAQQRSTEIPAFWGFIFALVGTGLALPTLGALTYAGPGFAQLFLQGAVEAPTYLLTIAMQDSMLLGIPAAIFYSVAYIFFALAIYKSEKFPNTLALLLLPHGALLSFGFAFLPLVYLSWVVLLIAGIVFIRYARLK
ncbi:MAG: hypothetical protein OEY38_11340 [Gammaproteobacteria bacterium]|nr:hypothetical protein [Gammaproteobacteria bacterium]